MERLCSLAMGIPFRGPCYRHFIGIVLRGKRRAQCCLWRPCDVFRGFRTRARTLLSRQWVRGPQGFVRRADPLLPGPYRYFGWQAAAVPGGACGGLDYPRGLPGQLVLKVRLRRTRHILEELPFLFYIKVGVLAPTGAVGGLRLVPPRFWSPVPPEQISVTRTVSSDGRFLNVEVRWV